MKADESHWAVDQKKKPSHAIATYEVSTAVPGPRTVYRASFDFGFELPSPESSVSVDPASARLRGTFDSLRQQVAKASIADVSPPIVTLDSAREVVEVDLNGFSGRKVQLFRADQSAVAPQPTVSSTANSAGKAAFNGFTDVHFAVGVASEDLRKSEIGKIWVEGAPTGARLGLADPAAPAAPPAFFWTAPNGTETDANAGSAFGVALQAYLAAKQGDTSPTATLVIQCDQPCTFALTAFDTGASFALDGFAFPELLESDLSDPDALAAKIAAAADPVSAHLRSVIGSATLLDGLNAVVASDALYDPARFAGITLSPQTEAARSAHDLQRTNRLLLQDAYPDLVAAPSAKRVLRFAPDHAGQAAVAVSLPAGAAISRAALSTQESLRDDRPENAEAATEAGGSSGVHVSGDDTAGVSVTVDGAVSATGLALPLLALTGDTQVAVELRQDEQGAPAGKPLATATATPSFTGAVEWSTVYFDPVVLGSGPVWIVLRAAKGEAVWLAATGTDDLRVVRTPDDAAPTETLLPGLQPLYQLLSRSGSAADAPATTLQLGGTTVTPARDGDKSTYDLAAALKTHAGTGGAVQLTFTSTAGGTITVDPPHVEFDV